MTPLTREAVEKMEAGPEMDALVAEAIGMEKIALHGGVPGATNFYYVNANQYLDGSPPAFSTDIAAAWRVVAYFTTVEGHGCLHHFETIYYAGEDQWAVEIGAREDCRVDVTCRLPQNAWTESLPLAICRAALLATL